MPALEEILNDISCVDAGAAGGLTELKSLSKFLNVFSFEPLPESFNTLRNSAKLNSKFKKHEIFPYALHSNTGIAKLHIANRPSMSSLLEFDEVSFDKNFGFASGSSSWKQMLGEKETIDIKTVTLDKWSAENGIKQIDFLKLDTQGIELEILKGAEKLLNTHKILVIKTEFSNFPVYKNQCLFSDIDVFLRANGFELAACLYYPDTTYQTGKSSVNGNNRLSEIPPIGAGGDAIYVLNTAHNDIQNALKAGMILSSLGEFSMAFQILNKTGLSKNEIEQLMIQTAPQKSFKRKLMEFIPPVLIKLSKKIR